MYEEIKKCRICGNSNLDSIINLGNQSLTGIFPKNKTEDVPKFPLELIKCDENNGGCGLLQLKHKGDLSLMYGKDYGYRSGLNKSMVNHLNNIVKKILNICELKENDLIIDIGSNDSTLLRAYPQNLNLVGIDPTGIKFKKYYPEHIDLITDFFPSKQLGEKYPNKKAKIITSIAMFYDLEDPLRFMQEVYNNLEEEGIWVFEQSYMPLMIDNLAYDTICHEHLEYYRLQQIKWMADKIGFKIIDVEFNDTNGGSFLVIIAKKDSIYKERRKLIEEILTKEKDKKFHTLEPYLKFKGLVSKHKKEFINLLNNLKSKGKTVFGYGASTKGNVILQYCDITEKELPYILEVNTNKFGSYTPGTKIHIISEEEGKRLSPDYLIVFPWHFKKMIIEKEKSYIEEGGKFIFLLPEIDVIKK